MTERQIFEGALEFTSAADRQAFLDKACGNDPALRASIEALLASHDGASQFLNEPAVEQLRGETAKGLEQTIDRSLDMGTDEETSGPDLSFLQPSTKPGSIGSLGHYEILQVLGQGAFGVVFRAFDEKLHRQVAVKAMNPELAATSPPRKRFLREARSVAAIKHENIVQIYSVEEQPLPYLVMEFVQGQTLQQKLEGHGPLDVTEILHLGRQMAAGLAAAHALGMIHRDIKPGNILLEQGAEQRVKITDFGLARAADDANMTRTGVIAGTPMYMSPEQAEGRTLDARSDLFSLGSVLYQMATGRPPFRAPNTIAVLRRVVEDQPRAMQEIIADLPPWLEAIVFKLLEKAPENRFQSAKEVAELFARCQTELQLHGKVTCVAATSQAALPNEPKVTTAAHETSAKQNRWLVAVPAILVVFLLGMYLINRAVDRYYLTPANAPDDKPTQVAHAPPVQRFTSGEWIDVIPLIEPQKDKLNVAKQTGKNAWRIEQGELVVGGDALSSKLLLPLDSDWPAYECEVEFTRRAGENGLNINLPTSDGECPVVIDPPGFACVHLGNQQRGAKLQVGKQIFTNQRTTVHVEVHRAPNNNDRVSVALNGSTTWDWTGDLNALALPYRENFPQDRRITLWIHRGGEYVFHRIRVRMLDGGVASSLRPSPPPTAPNTPAVVNWKTYFAKNRLAAERALARGGEVMIEIPNKEWQQLSAGQSLPATPFVVRMWSVKNSTTVTNDDLDVLAGLRHIQPLNLTAKGRLNADIIPKLAAIRSPLEELGLGHLNLKTSEIDQLPSMPNVHLLWLTADQVDDNWRFLRRFPALRTIELYGSPLPDLSPLGNVPQLRVLRISDSGEPPTAEQIHDLQTRHPQLRILHHNYATGDKLKILGADPAQAAARRFIAAGIPVYLTGGHGAHKPLTLEELEKTVAHQYFVPTIPRGIALTEELRGLLTHFDLMHLEVPEQQDADELARALSERQDLFTLSILNSDLTDVGLRDLQKLTGLMILNVSGTQVTAAGVAAFHQNVPDCQLLWNTQHLRPAFLTTPLTEPSSAKVQEASNTPSKSASENLESYFARNRQAAERALAVGGEVAVEITMPSPDWRTLKPGDSLPAEPFVVRMWSIKNSKTATSSDLDVLAGLRHVHPLNLSAPGRLDAEIIPKIAALRSPVKELSIGHCNLKTSALERLPVMPHVHLFWLTSEQVDDGWRFLSRFPALRNIKLYGSPNPDLSPLGDAPQLRSVRLTAWGKLPDAAQILDIQKRNPQLRILYESADELQVLGNDPGRVAARRLIEAGIPVKFFDAAGMLRQLTLDEVDKTVTMYYHVTEIPRAVTLTDELRGLLTHVNLQVFKAEGQRDADSLAKSLRERPEMDHLTLTDSDLTDEGLRHLSQLSGLRSLYMKGTQVTPAGVAAFHRAVPSCGVQADSGDINPEYQAADR